MTVTTGSPTAAEAASVESAWPVLESGDGSDRELLARCLILLESPSGACWMQRDRGLVCLAATADVAASAPDALGDGNPVHAEELRAMLAEGQAVLRNDAVRLSPAQAPFERLLAAPISLGKEPLGLLLAANRPRDYTAGDMRLISLLASVLAPHLQLRRESLEESADPEHPAQHDRHQQLEQACHHLEQSILEHVALAVESELSLRALQTQHQELLDATPAVVYVKDLDGKYLFVNREYLDVFQLRREDIVGRTDFEIFNAPMAEEFTRNDRWVATANQVLRIEEIAPHSDGPHTYMTVKFPIHDAAGGVKATAGISTDITDRIRLEQQADSLSRRLALILDAVGDGVYGVDAHGRLEFLNPTGEQLLGWTEQELLGKKIHELIHAPEMLASPDAVDLRVGSEEAVLLKVADDHVTFRTRDGRDLPVEYVCTPIRDGERISGAVVTFRDLSERLARDDADRRGRDAMQKAEATIHDLIAARDVQRTMLPERHPVIQGFDIAGATFPRELVSGDFFDYIPQADGSLIIVVADASGHDLAAAVQMVESHAALHAYLDCGVSLGELLVRLNQMLSRHLMGRFISMFLARLDPSSRTLEFAGAGHDAALLRADGGTERLPSTGIVLGVDLQSFSPRFESTQLHPGDTVLLSTDGFQETFSPSRTLFGQDRLIAALRDCRGMSASATIERLYGAARAHAAGQPQADDMTAVVIRAT